MLIQKSGPERNECNNADRDISPSQLAKRRRLRLTWALLGFPHLPTDIDELGTCRGWETSCTFVHNHVYTHFLIREIWIYSDHHIMCHCWLVLYKLSQIECSDKFNPWQLYQHLWIKKYCGLHLISPLWVWTHSKVPSAHRLELGWFLKTSELESQSLDLVPKLNGKNQLNMCHIWVAFSRSKVQTSPAPLPYWLMPHIGLYSLL